MNLSLRNTGQVCLLSPLNHFYMSYCPFLKFSFQDFSLSSFEILALNLIYEFASFQREKKEIYVANRNIYIFLLLKWDMELLTV